MRGFTLVIALLFGVVGHAQEGDPGETVSVTVTYCHVEDIYTCEEIWRWNQDFHMTQTPFEGAILGTCAEGACTSNAPDQENIDINTHPVTCSLSGNKELEVLDNTLRAAITFVEITLPYPPGSDPAAGRKHTESHEETTTRCVDFYDCKDDCQLTQGAHYPFSISEFQCERFVFKTSHASWWEMVVSGNELCVADKNQPRGQ